MTIEEKKQSLHEFIKTQPYISTKAAHQIAQELFVAIEAIQECSRALAIHHKECEGESMSAYFFISNKLNKAITTICKNEGEG